MTDSIDKEAKQTQLALLLICVALIVSPIASVDE